MYVSWTLLHFLKSPRENNSEIGDLLLPFHKYEDRLIYVTLDIRVNFLSGYAKIYESNSIAYFSVSIMVDPYN